MEEEKRRRKQMEEQARKRLEEQRTKMELERKQKIEEARIKLQLAEEEQRKKEEAEEEERRQAQLKQLQGRLHPAAATTASISMASTSGKAPTTTDSNDFDLLTTGLDDLDIDDVESSSATKAMKSQQVRTHRATDSAAIISSRTHRNIPKRGPLDEFVDVYLDSMEPPSVAIVKYGKNDGVYLFGSRLMKITAASSSTRGHKDRTVHVLAGNQQIPLEDFISKFEKVETMRLKGLKSAQAACNMLLSGQIPVATMV